MSALYDRIARIYDPWSASVREDVDLYVEEALASGGPVVELAVGTAIDVILGIWSSVACAVAYYALRMDREQVDLAHVTTVFD